MKKILAVITGVLALNFLAVAGGLLFLKSSGHLDKIRALAIKEILFPTTQESAAATQPSDAAMPATQPIVRLENLLAQQTGRPASEQVDFIQHTFDGQMAQVDRRQRELADLQRQVELAKQQLAHDRATISTQQEALKASEDQAAKQADDKGFQDTLALYRSMTGKQVKTIFMAMDDRLVAQYLDAMEPRAAAKIIKEFKAPEETQFMQKVLERVRVSQAAAAGPTTKEK